MRISFFAAAAIAAYSSALSVELVNQTPALDFAEEGEQDQDQFLSYLAKVAGTAGYNTLMDKDVQKCILQGAGQLFHDVTGHEEVDDEDGAKCDWKLEVHTENNTDQARNMKGMDQASDEDIILPDGPTIPHQHHTHEPWTSTATTPATWLAAS